MFGSFGGIYATEPVLSSTSHVVYWDSDNIRFHWPTEHTLNGTAYALEMQVFGTDLYGRHLLCSNNAAVSVLFNLDTTADANPFFDWQAATVSGDPVMVNLDLVLTKITGTINSVTGYAGTDSMPGCTYGTCWYILNEVQTINQTELDFFLN
jgi:carbonic anhydrase